MSAYVYRHGGGAKDIAGYARKRRRFLISKGLCIGCMEPNDIKFQRCSECARIIKINEANRK